MSKLAPVVLGAVVGLGSLMCGGIVQARPVVIVGGLPLVVYPGYGVYPAYGVYPGYGVAYPGYGPLGPWRGYPYRYWHGGPRRWR
jgi:hypothetical protein